MVPDPAAAGRGYVMFELILIVYLVLPSLPERLEEFRTTEQYRLWTSLEACEAHAKDINAANLESLRKKNLLITVRAECRQAVR